MAEYIPENKSNVRVTVSADSNRSLRELFNPHSQRQQVPLHQRKLPKSFFVPPTGNIDSAHMTDLSSTDLIISHSKANSSPACLDAALCTIAEPSTSNHSHQKSLDIMEGSVHGYCQELLFLNRSPVGYLHTHRDTRSPIYPVNYPIAPLPLEYEMTQNENGKVYFLNHKTKETTWFDPRIPKEEQKWGMTLDELQQAHANYAQSLGYSHMFGALLEHTSPIAEPNAIMRPNAIPCSTEMRGSTGVSNSIGQPTSPNMLSTVINPPGPTSSSSSQSTNSTVASAVLKQQQQRLLSNPQPTPIRNHPAKLPHVAHQQAAQQPSQQQPQATTDHNAHVHHHRQHSNGHSSTQPITQPTAANLLGTHLRSCSQPVPMPVGSNPQGLLNPNTTSRSMAQTNDMDSMSGLVCGLPTSSSLIGLGMTAACSEAVGIGGPMLNRMSIQRGCIGSIPQQAQANNCLSGGSSSGQLVQGLECLRLNTVVTPAMLSSSSMLHDSQQQQHAKGLNPHQLQTSFMVPFSNWNQSTCPTSDMGYVNKGNTNNGNPNAPGVTSQTSNPSATTPVPSVTQHSHQGSMDSGVGQSLADHSNPSTNHTPERTVMLFCDPNQNDCNAEHMEGISYLNEDIDCAPLHIFDNIDISDIPA